MDAALCRGSWSGFILLKSAVHKFADQGNWVSVTVGLRDGLELGMGLILGFVDWLGIVEVVLIRVTC